MGCSNSNRVGETRKIGGEWIRKTVVDLPKEVDWDKRCERSIKEFPMYADRLKDIDYQSAIDAGIDWIDPNFAHDDSSLMDPRIRNPMYIHGSWNRYSWRRPEQEYGEGNFVLYDQPGPNDVKQGNLGDCYFLAGLSALAEYPDRI